MKALIDTSVWLDIAADRQPFCETSKGAVMACINDDVEMFVVATSLKDIFYLMARGFGAAQAYASIEAILDMASVASVDGLVCKQALGLERPDYEDGIVAASALAETVDCIITRDAEAFAHLGLPRFSPADFLKAQGYEEIDWFAG